MAAASTSNGTALHASRCFRVEIADSTVGVFSSCTGIELEYEVMEYSEGGLSDYVHKLRGGIKYRNLVLTRGITDETALLDWLLDPEPRTVTISLLDGGTGTVRSWGFSQGVPVRWVGPTLSDATTELASETLEIAHNGLVPQASGPRAAA